MDHISFAESSKHFVISYFLRFDEYLLIEGPSEAFYIFLSNYGNQCAPDIMKIIESTDVFTQSELSILKKIEDFMIAILGREKGRKPFNFLEKEDYLKMKDLLYDFFTLESIHNKIVELERNRTDNCH